MHSAAIVVGGGPAGLAAAEVFLDAGCSVELWEAMPSPGRKLLLAGSSGLNLSNARPLDEFLQAYGGSCAGSVAAAVAAWPTKALRAWAASLGSPLREGSGRRLYPQEWQASQLLTAWQERLCRAGLVLVCGRRVLAIEALQPEQQELFEVGQPASVVYWQDSVQQGQTIVSRQHPALLALGGGSWPQTGSDGRWLGWMQEAGVAVADLQAANCGINCRWDPVFAQRWAGSPLRNVILKLADRQSQGQCVVTIQGIEGQALYPLIPELRRGSGPLSMDLRPDRSLDWLTERLRAARPKDSLANRLRKAAGLSSVASALLRSLTPTTISSSPEQLAACIKSLALPFLGLRPLAEAISSAGGIRADALDGWRLRALPGVSVAGEMLDWEAPTGGWLLHACLASGRAAAAQCCAQP